MSQETEPESFPLACSLDDTGYVRHAERPSVPIGDNAQLGRECGERVIGYLRFGGRDYTEHGGLAGIREADKTHVRQYFELHDDRPFLRRFTGLCITGRLVGGGTEMPVSQSSATAFEEHHALVMLLHLADKFPRLPVIDDCAARHFDNLVLAVFAEGTALTASASVSSHDMFLVLEVQEGPEVPVSMQDYRPALTAIAAVRSAFGQIFGTMEVHTPGSALARAAVYLHVVDKISHEHLLFNHLPFGHLSKIRSICRNTSSTEWFPLTGQ